jgi:hypothetical protein
MDKNHLNQFDQIPSPPSAPEPEQKRNLEFRCTATSKTTGERCGKPALFGHTVCEKHGANGASKAKVQRRLEGLQSTALDVWEDELTAGPPCEACGRGKRGPNATKVAQQVLDRTGFGPSASLKVSRDEAAPWTAWSTNEELLQGYALKDAAVARMEAGEPPFGQVREFDIPEDKLVWLPKSERKPVGEEVIEAVFTTTQTEAQ